MLLLPYLLCALQSVPLAPTPQAPTAKQVRKALRLPSGSLSLGMTNKGGLHKGVALPAKGRGWAIFPSFVPKETQYGTTELIALIKHAAGEVARQFPGSVLGIGNISREGGGQTGSSVSHKSGRDADLAMFARDTRDRPVNLRSFISFHEDGWDKAHRYRFDVPRNAALVAALVSVEETPVQFIFTATWLKEGMIAHAIEAQFAPDIIARMKEVLHQPSDSNPHHNHFHLRVYCSVQDRLHGCLERGPLRDWANLGDESYQARVDKLVALLEVPSMRLKRSLLKKLGELRAARATPAFLRYLKADDRKLRRAALASLSLVIKPEAKEGLLEALAIADSLSWAKQLVTTIKMMGVPAATEFATRLLNAPRELLPEGLLNKRDQLQALAADILGAYGRKEALTPLLRHIDAEESALRSAAHKALLRVTNQRYRGRMTRARDRKKLVAAWQRFADAHGDESWLQWLKRGFEARGYRFQGDTLGKEDLDTLVKAIGHKERTVWHNAVHALSEITGHVVDPRWRKQRNNARHWRSWLKQQASQEAP